MTGTGSSTRSGTAMAIKPRVQAGEDEAAVALTPSNSRSAPTEDSDDDEQRTLKFKIYRYDPDKDAKPYMQDISVEVDGTDRKLLDAMVKLKAKDDSLSFRRSCREGVCGSDAMNINGKNGLACLTAMDSFPEGKPIVLRPLPGLPVIRDLIVDMTQFFKQYNSIKPYLINNDPPPERERLDDLEDLLHASLLQHHEL
jgi:succinate dehydrogenase/fumarate reductase iron-sulfur protein